MITQSKRFKSHLDLVSLNWTAFAVLLNSRMDLWTRQGKPINSCPHIWESVRSIVENSPDIVLDGELYNHDLKEDFNKITSLVRKSKSTPEDILEAEKMVEYHVTICLAVLLPNLLFAQRTHVLEAYYQIRGDALN